MGKKFSSNFFFNKQNLNFCEIWKALFFLHSLTFKDFLVILDLLFIASKYSKLFTKKKLKIIFRLRSLFQNLELSYLIRIFYWATSSRIDYSRLHRLGQEEDSLPNISPKIFEFDFWRELFL